MVADQVFRQFEATELIVADDAPRLDARRIALLPRGAGVVNVASAGLIDATAMFAALSSGQLANAYLAGIAPDSPLRTLSNVMFAAAQ